MKNKENNIIGDLSWILRKGLEGAKEFEGYYYSYKDLVNERPTQEGLNQARCFGAFLNIITSEKNN